MDWYESHDILFAAKAYSVDFRDFGVNLGDVGLEKVGLSDYRLEKKRSEIRQNFCWFITRNPGGFPIII